MDDTLTDPLTGRLLDGRYAVSARLAHGGMATVYRALDTRLDREVALKVMHAELARDGDFVRRFIDEAKSVARLSHQNVVAVYDQGADGPFLYLAMEFVPGRTLKDMLRAHGRLPVATALDVMAGVLDGLAAAHACGIAHRDVKPENVLITADGRVKVADFGLARAQAAAGHTRSGMIIGTVAYLAPEQVTGETASGPRSDVYSAGVLLFEMLTGRQPFTGETPIAVAYQHVNGAVPPPSSLDPSIPTAVDRLVLAATSRDPAARPADAAGFLRLVREARAPLGPVMLRGLPGAGVPGAGEAPWLDFGSPRAGTDDDGYGGSYGGGGSHTLVVHRADAGGFTDGDRGGSGGRGSLLGRWLFSGRLGLLAVIVVLLAGIGLGGWYYAAGRYAPVPDVAGFSVSQASQALTDDGFKVVIGPPEHSNSVAKNLVAGTTPSGRALKGATITIHPSAGPFVSTVPPVKGMTLQAAKAALAKVHLTLVSVQQVGSTAPKGTVVGVSPKAGTAMPQTQPVTLLVAGGPPLPDFVGMTQGQARQLAAQDQIQLSVTQDQNSTQPQGTVTAQQPGKGTIMTPGETVTITVSAGPQLVPLPDVILMKISDARAILEAAGFTVNVQGSDFLGRVWSEDPSPNQEVPAGSVITLFVNPLGVGGNGGGN